MAMRPGVSLRILLGVTLVLAALAPSAGAVEATVFLSRATPSDTWGSGGGGALSITLFELGGVEVEGARQSLKSGEGNIVSLSGRDFVAPSFGKFVPYGGLSMGVRRETLRSQDDWGTMSGVFVGLKLKLPLGLRARVEYQWVHLPSDALVPMDSRYYGGVGLGF